MRKDGAVVYMQITCFASGVTSKVTWNNVNACQNTTDKINSNDFIIIVELPVFKKHLPTCSEYK